MNEGERDELLAILKLLELQQKGKLFDGSVINSIACGKVNCRNLPSSLILNQAVLLSDSELDKLARSWGVTKAPSSSKSDVIVNGVGYSIKSNRMAPPALVNHTARPGFENVCHQVNQNILPLDALITDYWKKRKAGVIREDVKNSDTNSPFKNSKNYFRPILNYFLFKGTGSRKSSFPSEKILSFTNPINENTWQIHNKNNALDIFWDKLIFSVRAKKGMPLGYPDDMTKMAMTTKPSIDKWTEYIDNNYRGALHIRSTK